MPLRLTALVGLLMAAAAGVGLIAQNVYRDNELVRASWYGNDLVTLAVAVPLLAAAVFVAKRESALGYLLALGSLAYAVYNYAFYLFGAAYNGLFLVYVAIVAVSVLGLIAGLTSPEVATIVRTLRPTRVDRITAIVIMFVAGGLGLFWITVSAGYWVSGQVPAMIAATEHPTNIIGALDLTLVVTFGLLGGLWLFQGKAWGHVISVIWAAKGALYMTALSASTYVTFRRQEVDSLAQLGIWVPVGLVSAACLAVLLRTIRQQIPTVAAR